MRNAECPDTEAGPRVEGVRASTQERPADFDRQVLQVFGQAQADSGQVLGFAALGQPRELAGSRHLLPRTVLLRPDHLHPDGMSLSAATSDSASGAFIIGLSSLTIASAARRLSSSAADYFWVRPFFLPTLVTITPITMERNHRRSRLS
jgi:hypothetical protein